MMKNQLELIAEHLKSGMTATEAYSRNAIVKQLGPDIHRTLLRDKPGIWPVNVIRSAHVSYDENVIKDVVLRMFEDLDFTKNKMYTTFLALNYARGGWGANLEDIASKVIPALKNYHTLRERGKLKIEHKDIYKFQGFEELLDVVDSYADVLQQEKIVDRGTYEEVLNNSQVRIIIPHDEAAACYYGQGTRWCTAATQGQNYFDDYYSPDDPLYIVIPKNGSTERDRQGNQPDSKYQLQFGSGQFMDAADDPIDIVKLLTTYNLWDFFKERVPKLADSIYCMDESIYNHIIDQIYERVVEFMDELMFNAYIDEYRDYVVELGYVEKDKEGNSTGQPDWDNIPDHISIEDIWNEDDRRYYARVLAAAKLPRSRVPRLLYEYADYGAIDTIILPDKDDIPNLVWLSLKDAIRHNESTDVLEVPLELYVTMNNEVKKSGLQPGYGG